MTQDNSKIIGTIEPSYNAKKIYHRVMNDVRLRLDFERSVERRSFGTDVAASCMGFQDVTTLASNAQRAIIQEGETVALPWTTLDLLQASILLAECKGVI
jgi:hypothetical protein